MKRMILVALAALSVTGCASVQRLGSYGGSMAVAQIQVQGRAMNVFVHPQDPTLLVGMKVGDGAVDGLVRGLTFGLADGFNPDPRQVDASVATFLRPVGCTAQPVVEIGSDDMNFEARYTCPEGFDLRSAMRAQRAGLMQGQPLRQP